MHINKKKKIALVVLTVFIVAMSVLFSQIYVPQKSDFVSEKITITVESAEMQEIEETNDYSVKILAKEYDGCFFQVFYVDKITADMICNIPKGETVELAIIKRGTEVENAVFCEVTEVSHNGKTVQTGEKYIETLITQKKEMKLFTSTLIGVAAIVIVVLLVSIIRERTRYVENTEHIM